MMVSSVCKSLLHYQPLSFASGHLLERILYCRIVFWIRTVENISLC